MAPSDVKIRCQQTLTTSQVNYLPKEVLQVVGVIETMIREISLRIINFCVFFFIFSGNDMDIGKKEMTEGATVM